jgi:hypothetical protein
MLESENTIISIGIIVHLIKSNLNEFDLELEEIPNLELNNFLSQCKLSLKVIKGNKNILKKLIGEDFESKIEIFENFISNYDKKSECIKNKQIIKETISFVKIENFKSQIKDQWTKYNNLEKVFKYFKTPSNEVLDLDLFSNSLKPNKILFRKGKILFIEENYQPVYGLEFGLNLCIQQNKFFKDFLSKKISPSYKENLLEVLNELRNLNNKENSINVIFVPLHYWYLHEIEIIKSGNFKPINQINDKFEFDLLGIFDEKIFIVPLAFYDNDSIVIAIDTNDSIKIERILNKEWIDNTVMIDVNEIDANSIEVFKNENINASEFEFSEFQTSIYLTIGMYFNLKILHSEKIKIYKLN